MTVECALCKSFMCRSGTREGTPENCPMGDDFPEFGDLYGEEADLAFLGTSALIESGGYCQWTRLNEIREFSLRMGFKTLGLAHCPDMAGLAKKLATAFQEVGVDPVLPPPTDLDDPAAQAVHFSEMGTELNVLGGMCVGHEALFLRSSSIPTVSLIARDSRLFHNPAAGIYTSRSYLKDDLFGHWPKKERPAFSGWNSEAVARISCTGGGYPEDPPSRLEEALTAAHTLGAHRIGLSFCVGLKEEAKAVSGILKSNGFEVSSTCCKTGAVPKEEAGIADSQKIRPGRPEMICNPLAQGELLNRDEVEFVMILGQCVGHDSLTLGKLEAPAVYLVAKDRVLAHNSIAALHSI